MKSYSRVCFTDSDLSEKAFDIYSNSSFVFYKYKYKECYLVADNAEARPNEIGTITDIEEYLLECSAQAEQDYDM